MIKSKAIKYIDYKAILNMMLPEDKIKNIYSDVKSFYYGKHGVDKSVLNVIIIRAIDYTKGNLNGAYLRKALETFKAYNIDTVEKAIEYLENSKENNRWHARKNQPEPEWMDGYVENLVKMEG